MYKFVKIFMKEKEIINHIVNWIKNYLSVNKMNGLVIGISGGIDSSLTSTLCALTNKPTLCIELPIHQNSQQINRGKIHIDWLKKRYKNVQSIELDLTSTFDEFKNIIEQKDNLALANTRSRLRMMSLYYYAQINNYLVVGTGNKVEDFGIGFFTKYGDGGVDLSPIADLMKSEVFILSKYLDIDKSILTAEPTDGLWEDERTDEEQIGASYDEIEWAMTFNDNEENLNLRQLQILKIYSNYNQKNKHKMNPVPICKIPSQFK